MPSFTQWPKVTIWSLVPALSVERETDKAILFTQFRETPNERECWIPKSQIHFDVWAASKYFVGIAAWLAKQRGLFSCEDFAAQNFNPPWLRAQEKKYENYLQNDMKEMFLTIMNRPWQEGARERKMGSALKDDQWETALVKKPLIQPKRGRAINLEDDH